MSTVAVAVRRAGRIIDKVERPLRHAEDGPAVVYRKKYWRYASGQIDLDSRPLNPSSTAAQTGVSLPLKLSTDPAQVDDSAERQAICSAPASARMLVEAGPGTGKTEMAALRLSRLISSELSPGQVMVLSFSRSAVRTLTRRLARVVQPTEQVIEELRHVSIRTFDSWAFRILRLLGRSPQSLLAQDHDDNISELTSLMSGSRADEICSLIGNRRHLIVDEFQDLPGVRGEMVLALLALIAPPHDRKCGFTILGDPAQAIYGFAARAHDGRTCPSPAEYWTRVQETYGLDLEKRTLCRNYRAEASLAERSSDLRAVLLSDRPEEEKLRVVREAVAALPPPAEPMGPVWLQGDSGGSRAVLTRTNGEALRVLQKLLGRCVEGPPIPVSLRAGSYANLPPAWIGALLRRLRSQTLTRSHFSRIYAYLTGQWDADTQSKLGLPTEDAAWVRLARASGAPEDTASLELGELRSRLGWPDAFPDDQPIAEDGVIVTTIHQSKGMEFDIVTVLDAAQDDDDAESAEAGKAEEEGSASEQAKVAYVAITRAGRCLNRTDGGELYPAPVYWDFQNGRRRLCHWRRGWINMEMGIRGDLDPFGFVDPALHGGADGVEELQEFLLRNARRLHGHKVMLCKHSDDRGAVWHVHLQNGSAPDRLIGRTASQLTFDLLKVLYSKQYPLPKTIMNLRIASVGTVTADGELALDEPERSSRMWLGVSLFGTGDFRTWKKGARRDA